MLTGDFILPGREWKSVVPKGSYEHYWLLVDIAFFSNNLSQVVKSPTCSSNVRKSLLDLVFLYETSIKSVFDVLIAGCISDHGLVCCDLSASRYVYAHTEKKRYRDFTRGKDIDILHFLEEALYVCLVFSEMNGSP